MASAPHPAKWPRAARAAVALTLDNMGEAADLQRQRWPANDPVGHHYSVRVVLPQILQLLDACHIRASYYIESWNLAVYGDVVADQIAAAGHEVGWHAWQHEPWHSLVDPAAERANFERSFGPDGVGGFTAGSSSSSSSLVGAAAVYRGFRPPGGIVHGDRTLRLCREFGLDYLSPAGHEAALVPVQGGPDSLVILPFRWPTVDAYYYMETFAGLRQIKGQYGPEPQSPQTLLDAYKRQLDEAIARGGFVSFLFHPFLTDRPERLAVLREFLEYLDEKRKQGSIWLARNCEIAQWIRAHPGIVADDPGWDTSQWR